MIVSGHQPNYLPWLGFFDKMMNSELFIIEDNVQFENRGYTNRNLIKQQTESKWLTVPVEDGDKRKPINEIKISSKGESDWARRHWLSIKYHYSNSPFWYKYKDFFEDAYERNWEFLIDINLHFINGIRNFLGIKTPMIFASSLNAEGHKSELVLAQCKAVGADIFFAGTGSRCYLNTSEFEKERLKIVFQDFKHPEYRQVHGEFIPNLSVIDFLFCCGGNLRSSEFYSNEKNQQICQAMIH
jgi:hypothetical protein